MIKGESLQTTVVSKPVSNVVFRFQLVQISFIYIRSHTLDLANYTKHLFPFPHSFLSPYLSLPFPFLFPLSSPSLPPDICTVECCKNYRTCSVLFPPGSWSLKFVLRYIINSTVLFCFKYSFIVYSIGGWYRHSLCLFKARRVLESVGQPTLLRFKHMNASHPSIAFICNL